MPATSSAVTAVSLPDGVTEDAAQRGALRIQCAFRCRKARKTTGGLRKQRSDDFERQCKDDLEIDAAISLQTFQRKIAAKRVVEQRRRECNGRGPIDVAAALASPSFATTGSSTTPKTIMELYYPTSMSCFSTSINRAFALASVASFAIFTKEDPDAAKQLCGYTPEMKHGLLHECAAIVIQCQWRVRVARRLVAKLREQRQARLAKTNADELEITAAMDIQRTVRGHLDRKALVPPPQRRHSAPPALSRDDAALKIQSAQRQRQARRDVAAKRAERAAALARFHEEQLAQISVTDIQRHFRGHHTRVTLQQKQQLAQAPAPMVSGGSGNGLNQLFFNTGTALLDSTSSTKRNVFWGVRVLHTVCMDLLMVSGGGLATRMPKLEVSRWIQGPLGSVIPLSRLVTHDQSAPRSGRLPALEHRPTPRADGSVERSSTTAEASSAESPSSRPRQLAPLQH